MSVLDYKNTQFTSFINKDVHDDSYTFTTEKGFQIAYMISDGRTFDHDIIEVIVSLE